MKSVLHLIPHVSITFNAEPRGKANDLFISFAEGVMSAAAYCSNDPGHVVVPSFFRFTTHTRSNSAALPEKIFVRSSALIGAFRINSTPSSLELNGQSTAKRMRSAPSSDAVQTKAGCEKLPLVVT